MKVSWFDLAAALATCISIAFDYLGLGLFATSLVIVDICIASSLPSEEIIVATYRVLVAVTCYLFLENIETYRTNHQSVFTTRTWNILRKSKHLSE